MPKRLLDRWQPESIREFRASARQRFDDGLALAAAGRRTGAIYLWGYCAEIVFKAAYFSLLGLAETDVLTWNGHFLPAIDRGKNAFQINWPNPEKGHNVRAWSELLIAERLSRGAPYPTPRGTLIQRCGQQIGQLWSVTLRYHKNVAYAYEVARIRRTVEWLIVNAEQL